jgi:hypothetical protein
LEDTDLCPDCTMGRLDAHGAGLPERGPVSAEQFGRAFAAVPVT